MSNKNRHSVNPTNIASLENMPFDKEAEQAVLGAFILKNKHIKLWHPDWPSALFFSLAHQKIFRAMRNLVDQHTEVDEVTLGTYLRDKGWLDEAGGVNYIVHLTQAPPVVENVDYYLGILLEKYQLREILYQAQRMSNSVSEDSNPTEIMNQSMRVFNALALTQDTKYRQIGQILKTDVLDRIEEATEKGGKIPGISWGYLDIDRRTHGLKKGELIILAGRPAMGKTTLAENVARGCGKDGKIIVIFSIEMTDISFATRALTSESKVDGSKIDTGELEQGEWDKLTLGATRLLDAKIFIDESKATPIYMRWVLNRIEAEYDSVDLVVVDYLQIVKPSEKQNSREREVSSISEELKQIAKDYKTPVLALSQLNRDLEKRQNRRPKMSDMRESGAIEQDADVVMSIYRDAVYNENSPFPKVAEIQFLKMRNGNVGTEYLRFEGETSSFDNLDYQTKSEVINWKRDSVRNDDQ